MKPYKYYFLACHPTLATILSVSEHILKKSRGPKKTHRELLKLKEKTLYQIMNIGNSYKEKIV